MKRILYYLLFILILSQTADTAAYEFGLSGQPSKPFECYMVLAGKEATVDGSMLLAHNNDLKGVEASLIEKHEAAFHTPDETVSFPSGLSIPQVKETYEWMVLRIYKGFAEGDAIAINEYKVSIAGGVALGGDRNENAKRADPLVKSGLTGGVRYVALQRSKTARECIELVGKLYTQYGVTYPSGFGVADANEIWYIESGGGHEWAAVRIPNNAVWIQANGYRIGEIDFSDSENYLTSPGLKELAQKESLWNPSEGRFHFARAFGRLKRSPDKEYYNSRRVWRGIDLIAPSLGVDPDNKEFPLFIIPDKKIDIKHLTYILRDHYQGTKYDIYSKDGIGSGERAIAVPTSIHSSIVQIRDDMPGDIGSILWGAVGSVPFSTYVPYYFGIDSIAAPFGIADEKRDPKSAFWVFKELCEKMTPNFYEHIDNVTEVWDELEDEELAIQSEVESKALDLYKTDKESALRFLTEYTNMRSMKSLEKAKMLLHNIK